MELRALVRAPESIERFLRGVGVRSTPSMVAGAAPHAPFFTVSLVPRTFQRHALSQQAQRAEGCEMRSPRSIPYAFIPSSLRPTLGCGRPARGGAA